MSTIRSPTRKILGTGATQFGFTSERTEREPLIGKAVDTGTR